MLILSSIQAAARSKAYTPVQNNEFIPDYIALLGDSISERASNIFYNGADIEDIYYENESWLEYMNHALYQRFLFSFDYNLGIGGDRTQDMISRMGDLAALDPAPRYVSVLAGTNDISNQVSPEIITTHLRTIYDYITGTIGARVIALPILPRSYFNNFSAAEIRQAKADILSVNAWIAKQAGKNIITAPLIYSLFQGSIENEPDPNYVTDGLHPSSEGAKIIGQELARILTPHAGSFKNGQWAEGSNLISNEYFSGTNGTLDNFSSGEIANDMRAIDRGDDGSASYRHYSKTPEGYQRIQIQAPAGSGVIGTYFRMFQQPLEAGERYYAELEIDSIKTDGLYMCSLILLDKSTENGVRSYVSLDKQGTRAQCTFGKGILRTPICTITSSSDPDHQVYIQIEGDSSAGDIDADIILKQVRLIKMS